MAQAIAVGEWGCWYGVCYGCYSVHPNVLTSIYVLMGYCCSTCGQQAVLWQAWCFIWPSHSMSSSMVSLQLKVELLFGMCYVLIDLLRVVLHWKWKMWSFINLRFLLLLLCRYMRLHRSPFPRRKTASTLCTLWVRKQRLLIKILLNKFYKRFALTFHVCNEPSC